MGTLEDEIVKWPFGVTASLVAAGVGYWIWRRQRQLDRGGQVAQMRQAAYRETWEALQTAEINIRGSVEHDIPSLEALIRDVNAIIMKHEIVLESDDRALAGEYLEAAHKLVAVIRAHGTDTENKAVSRTAILPPSTHIIAMATRDFLVARENVLSRARKALTT